MFRRCSCRSECVVPRQSGREVSSFVFLPSISFVEIRHWNRLGASLEPVHRHEFHLEEEGSAETDRHLRSSPSRPRRFRISERILLVDRSDQHGTRRVVQFHGLWFCPCLGRHPLGCLVRLGQVNIDSEGRGETSFHCDQFLFVSPCSSLLAAKYLDEKLNILGQIGCLLTVLGSVVIVIHAPSDNDVHSLNDFAVKILSPGPSLRLQLMKIVSHSLDKV